MKNPARLKRQALAVSSWLLKTAIGIVFISPLIIGLLFSFQSDQALSTAPLQLIPDHPTLENYIAVFQQLPMLSYLKNSLIVCGICIFSQITLAIFAAYAFVFFEFPLKKQLFSLILMTSMIPSEIVIITNYTTVQSLGFTDSYAGLVLPSLISGSAVFLMRQYFLTIPTDIRDAATIDGCGHMRFLFQIVLPLSVPTISALSVYLFVQIYNQFFWPLLVTNSDQWRTVQTGITYLVSGDIVSYGQILAGAMIAIIPTVLMFLFAQDHLIRGMSSDGIKG